MAGFLTPSMQIYNIGFILACTTSFFVYWAICTVFPDEAMKEAKAMGFEEMVQLGEIEIVDGSRVVTDEGSVEGVNVDGSQEKGAMRV